MIPNLWIMECLEMFGIAEDIKWMFCIGMENWTVQLPSWESVLREFNFKRKIKAAYEFSESKEKVSHMLFTDVLKLYNNKQKDCDSLIDC